VAPRPVRQLNGIRVGHLVGETCWRASVARSGRVSARAPSLSALSSRFRSAPTGSAGARWVVMSDFPGCGFVGDDGQ
jgi:hypothetical protein